MNSFRKDGHLTDKALATLIRGETAELLERLEISEHLAYCDHCLQRYTDLLEGVDLSVPQHSCRPSLARRIHRQTVRISLGRYAAAAAAVALALTVLWGGYLPAEEWPRKAGDGTEIQPEISWTEQYSAALDRASDRLRQLFDHISPYRSFEKGDSFP